MTKEPASVRRHRFLKSKKLKWIMFLTGVCLVGVAYALGAAMWLYAPGVLFLLAWLLLLGAGNMRADSSGIGSSFGTGGQ